VVYPAGCGPLSQVAFKANPNFACSLFGTSALFQQQKPRQSILDLATLASLLVTALNCICPPLLTAFAPTHEAIVDDMSMCCSSFAGL
jgi:hypothetical protein